MRGWISYRWRAAFGHDRGRERELGRAGACELVSCAVLALAGGRPQVPVPHLGVDAAEHDFGTVLEGEILTHTFHLVSDGTADLRISGMKPSCGCTLARLEVVHADASRADYRLGEALSPGTELELVVELDTREKHLQVASTIQLACNDPRGLVVLGLSVRLDSWFEVTPPELVFGEVFVTDRVEKSFTVVAPEPVELVLEESPLPGGMTVGLEPRAPDADGRARTWVVQVVLGPAANEGDIGTPIRLRSDHAIPGARPDESGAPATTGVLVIARARVVGVITHEPRLLSFGRVRPEQEVVRTLTLRSLDPAHTFPAGMGVRLVGADGEEFPFAASFSTTVERAADGRSASVRLTLVGFPAGFQGSFVGRMLVETGHPLKPELRVAFSGVCR